MQHEYSKTELLNNKYSWSYLMLFAYTAFGFEAQVLSGAQHIVDGNVFTAGQAHYSPPNQLYLTSS